MRRCVVDAVQLQRCCWYSSRWVLAVLLALVPMVHYCSARLWARKGWSPGRFRPVRCPLEAFPEVYRLVSDPT